MQSHTVVAGDTLWALAQRFYGSGNLYPVIAAANAIPNPDHIEVGQVLSIPDTPLTDVSGTRSYIVVAGDTLSAIAQKFYGNARLFAVIAAFNKIPDPDHINVGRVLIIPAVSTVYVVVPGDTLFAIAQRFYGDGLKFGVIATFNGIGNPNLIFPGQVLAIPGVAAPTRPRSPVSALRRAVDAAEIEFDRFDALVNTSPPLAAKFGAARATAKQRLDDARSALAQAITAEPAIWADAPLVPALLVPVRMEVRYRPNEQQPDAEPALAIRVVPDDIAVHSFEAELTDAEHAAAQQYWTTVSVAGVTDRDIAAGWTTILGQLGAARAAWAVEAMHPQTGAGGVLEFPDVGRRASTWTRAATSLLLPDRFVFRGWRRGKLVFEVTGADIPSDLAIGPDPTDLSQPGQHPLGWSAASAWMVDFDEALRVGMGALVPLTGTDVGFDEIVVVGVSDRRPDTASTDLARSLQGHLYTRGLAFLPDASPTNNTTVTRSEWSSAPAMRTPAEVDAAVDAEDVTLSQPGVVLSRAFGLGPTGPAATPGRRDLLAARGGTDPGDDAAIRRGHEMIASLYRGEEKPTGWLTDPLAHTHLVDVVRPAGPLPPIRIGRQPYGVLPVTPLSLWAPADGEVLPTDILTRLQRLHGLIGRYLPMSPRVGRGPDQDDVLMGLLRRTPTSAGVRFAQVTVGFSLFEPKLLDGVFPKLWWRVDGYTALAERGAPTLIPTPDVASSSLKFIDDFEAAQASRETLADEPPPPPMPAWMTWSSGLDAPARAAVGLYWNLTLDFAGTALFISLFFLKFARDVELTPNASQEDLDKVEQGRPALKLFRDALSDLATFEPKVVVDQGAVDRQFAGAIEALTHRVDSWVTSLATTRLRALRESQQTGIRLGAYGWLVDVEPTAPGARKADAGWVLTPSLTHAATAAVLHSGWAAHSHPDAFAVDLTSDRVRRAQAVLTALRDGRTLEELLGYQLERALHDGLADDLIAPLREAFPLPPVDPALGDGSEARAEHGRRIVVDGDAARRGGAGFIAAARLLPVEDGKIVFGPRIKVPLEHLDVLAPLFTALDDTVDAVGDLLLAEGVHQLVGGSPLRAGLTADTVGRANPVPDRLDVIATPRNHVTVTHAVGCAVAPSADPWPSSARAELDPVAEMVAAWALGEPEDWTVVVTPAGGAPDSSTLGDAGVAAIDVVAELTAPVDGSVLAARIRTRRGIEGTVRITRADGLGGDAALPMLSQTIRQVLVAARPASMSAAALTPRAPGDSADLTAVAARVSDWWAKVQQALTAWPDGSSDEQTAAMRTLAELGLAGAGFDTPTVVGASLAQRWATVTLPATDAPEDPEAADRWLNALRDGVGAAVGGWFLGAPLWADAAGGWSSLGGEEPTGDPVDQDDVEDWLGEHRDVRSGVTALLDAVQASGSVGSGVPKWLVRQHRLATNGDPQTGWVARRHPGLRSATHLAVMRIGPDAGPSRALLVVDQWVETVPAAAREGKAVPEQAAGLGFRFDRPDACAPQAVLLVAPPDRGRGWCLEDVHAAVDETLWWTRARALDCDDLPELRWVLG